MLGLMCKAKSKFGDEIVHGFVAVCGSGEVFIIQNMNNEPLFRYIPVYKESVCRCSGVKDKYGKIIYESDVIVFDKKYIGKIVYSDLQWKILWKNNDILRDDLDFFVKARQSLLEDIVLGEYAHE